MRVAHARLQFYGSPGGGAFGLAGAFVPVRQLRFGLPPSIGVEGGGCLTATKEPTTWLVFPWAQLRPTLAPHLALLNFPAPLAPAAVTAS